MNFEQAFFNKKGFNILLKIIQFYSFKYVRFNDKLNLIASSDFGNIKCSDATKKLQDIFFL